MTFYILLGIPTSEMTARADSHVEIKNADQIQRMRNACRVCAGTCNLLRYVLFS